MEWGLGVELSWVGGVCNKLDVMLDDEMKEEKEFDLRLLDVVIKYKCVVEVVNSM